LPIHRQALIYRAFLQVIRIEMNIGNQISKNQRLSKERKDKTMKFAYARVSTQDQNLDRQTDLLTDCDEVFIEKISGTKSSRPELDKMIGKLRTGDVVKVESFSRLGRSTKNLIELVDLFEKKGVQLLNAFSQWVYNKKDDPVIPSYLILMYS
jgi:predicted site-specific integrase-resolvase